MAQPIPFNVANLVTPGGVINGNPSVAQSETAQATGYTTHVGTFSNDFTFVYGGGSVYAQNIVLRYYATQTIIADLTLYAALNAASAPVTWAD